MDSTIVIISFLAVICIAIVILFSLFRPKSMAATNGEELALLSTRAALEKTMTAVANASINTNVDPISTDIPTQAPMIPSATPIPAPIVFPDTPANTQLSVGQTWYQNGKSLTLLKADLTSYAVANSEAVQAVWLFKNVSTHDISIKFTEDNFNASNNFGQQVSYKRFYDLPNGNGSTVVFSPGDSIKFTIDLWVGYSDPSVSNVVITVSLSDIQNASWNVPIFH